MYMARVVGMKAGVPKERPAYTVNRLCGTGVQAIVSGAQQIQTGEADVVIAGGAESMSRGPYWMPGARWGARMGDADARRSRDGRADRPVPRGAHGRHRREPRRVALHLPRGAGRVRRRVAPARRRGPGGGEVRRRDRAGGREGQARDGRLRPRRAPAPGRHGRVDGQAPDRVQEGRRDGDRRQRVGHERRRRGRGADERGAGRRAGHRGACADPRLRELRRGPGLHGHRPGCRRCARCSRGLGARSTRSA